MTHKRKPDVAFLEIANKKTKVILPSYWMEIDRSTSLGCEHRILQMIEDYLSLSDILFLRKLGLLVKNKKRGVDVHLDSVHPKVICHKMLVYQPTVIELNLYLDWTSNPILRINDLLKNDQTHLVLVDNETGKNLLSQQLGWGLNMEEKDEPVDRFILTLRFRAETKNIDVETKIDCPAWCLYYAKEWNKYAFFLETFGLNNVMRGIQGPIAVSPL